MNQWECPSYGWLWPYCGRHFLFFLSFISHPPSLKWVMHYGSNYPSPSQLLHHNGLAVLAYKSLLFFKGVHTNAAYNFQLRQQFRFRLSCDVLPPKAAFHQRSSSTEGCLPLKVVFCHWSSSTKGRLQPKVVFQWWSSSREGHLLK